MTGLIHEFMFLMDFLIRSGLEGSRTGIKEATELQRASSYHLAATGLDAGLAGPRASVSHR